MEICLSIHILSILMFSHLNTCNIYYYHLNSIGNDTVMAFIIAIKIIYYYHLNMGNI